MLITTKIIGKLFFCVTILAAILFLFVLEVCHKFYCIPWP